MHVMFYEQGGFTFQLSDEFKGSLASHFSMCVLLNNACRGFPCLRISKVDSHFCYQMSLKVLHISVFRLLNNVCEG